MSSPAAPAPPSRPGKKEIQVVRAIYTYTATQPDELSFEEGDILYVTSKSDPNWWKCKKSTTGQEGLVPVNYVGENTAVIDNPLHEAAKRGNVPFVKELIDAGVSVNALDKAGNSPVHWAARSGHADIVQMLIEKKSVINSQNKLGDTPLHLAAWGGHASVIKLLLAQPGIEVSLKNKDQSTPLQLCKSDEAASLLIQFGSPGGGLVDSRLALDDEDED